AYVEQLAGAGLRKETTLTELAPQIGMDPAVITDQLLPALSKADRATLQAALQAPVPIKYLVSVETKLLVEPTTGAIVSLDHVDQTLSAQPDLSGLEGFGAILAKPQYADEEVVQATLRTVQGLSGTLPVAVMKFEYAQTPASVADLAAYADDKASEIKLVEMWIPLGIAGLGMFAAMAAAITLILRPSRTPVAA
ncbi:MAG TPA: porin PorA family protein, partial [Solirubrobacter sp.]|nr:porin PorA family protein [Solirubrobacter sp.]